MKESIRTKNAINNQIGLPETNVSADARRAAPEEPRADKLRAVLAQRGIKSDDVQAAVPWARETW